MISIKGLREGLLIIFSGDDESWLTRLRDLEGKLNANTSFFQGGQVAFDAKGLELSQDDLRRARELLDTHQVRLFAVLTRNDTTRRNALALGLPDALPVYAPAPRKPRPAVAFVTQSPAPAEPSATPALTVTASLQYNASLPELSESEAGTDGVVIKRKVRSGQVERHPGHIVVLGDVSQGAEIIAGGDIIVWGRLLGTAHAGAFGNDDAIVCALELKPQLLKISDIAIREHKGKSEMARVHNQELSFTRWENKP